MFRAWIYHGAPTVLPIVAIENGVSVHIECCELHDLDLLADENYAEFSANNKTGFFENKGVHYLPIGMIKQMEQSEVITIEKAIVTDEIQLLKFAERVYKAALKLGDMPNPTIRAESKLIWADLTINKEEKRNNNE